MKTKRSIGVKPKYEKGELRASKYVEIGKLAMRLINIAFHDNFTTAKRSEKAAKKVDIPITIEISIPILNTSSFVTMARL